MGRKGAGVRLTLPRLRGVITDAEWPAVRRKAGPVLLVLLAVLMPAHRRRERLVFG